jgi:putative Mg2+ transporter-C (MgtC) family protein
MEPITVQEMSLRVFLALVAGFVVGWERESRGRPAGLRTNILACVAAAVAMILSEILFLQSAAATPSGTVRADPGRLGAGILTGIGFLGAGTILRHENFVRGVTTAASLWLVTVLGLVFGSGRFALGAIGLGVALLTLLVLPRLERGAKSDWYATLSVKATLAVGTEDLIRQIKSFGPILLDMKLSCDLENRQKTFTCELRLKRPERFELPNKIVAALSRDPGVLQINWS